MQRAFWVTAPQVTVTRSLAKLYHKSHYCVKDIFSSVLKIYVFLHYFIHCKSIFFYFPPHQCGDFLFILNIL
nr:MAG TPA: hypothetical protein [Caudoviricetes sp.]